MVRERGMQRSEELSLVGTVSDAREHPRRERGPRRTLETKRVEVSLDNVALRSRVDQFGGSR